MIYMNCIPQNCNSYRLLRCKILEIFNQPGALRLVIFGRPVVVKIIQYLDAAVELVNQPREHSCPAESLDRVENSTGEDVFKPNLFRQLDSICNKDINTYQSWISNRHTQENNQVLGLAFDDFPMTTVPDVVVCLLAHNFLAL